MSVINDVTLSIIKNFVAGDYSTTELVGDLEALGEAYAEEKAAAVAEVIKVERERALETIESAVTYERGSLGARIKRLEAALEEARSAKANVVTVKSFDLFNNAPSMRDQFISYVKWVRNSGVVTVNGEAGCIGLYEARFIAEYVFAFYGYKEFIAPMRGEPYRRLNIDSNRKNVVDNIRLLLVANLPDYVLDIRDPYEG